MTLFLSGDGILINITTTTTTITIIITNIIIIKLQNVCLREIKKKEKGNIKLIEPCGRGKKKKK